MASLDRKAPGPNVSQAGEIPTIPANVSHRDELEAAREGFELAAAELARAFAQLVGTEMRIQMASALSGLQPPAAAATGTVDVEGAMKLLGISRDSLYKQIKSKALPSLKIGGRRVFRTADIEAFLAKQVEGHRW